MDKELSALQLNQTCYG